MLSPQFCDSLCEFSVGRATVKRNSHFGGHLLEFRPRWGRIVWLFGFTLRRFWLRLWLRFNETESGKEIRIPTLLESLI
jgi:hypothetical protein